MLHGICHLDNYSYSGLEILNFYSFEAQSVQRLGYGLDDPGFESRQEQKLFLFPETSITSLGPNMPPIQR